MSSQNEYEQEVWGLISKVVEEEGLLLFDLDLPARRGAGSRGVSSDDGTHAGDDAESSDGDRPVGVGVFRVIVTRSPHSVDKNGAAHADAEEVGEDSGVDEDNGEVEEGGMEVVDESSTSPAPRRVGVSLDQCARVARRLLDIDEEQPFVPDGCELEVSSPGINRRLRRPEHFATVVGERVKVKFRNEKGGTQVVTGVVTSFEGDVLHVAGEGASGEVSMPLAHIKEARVDFRFG